MVKEVEDEHEEMAEGVHVEVAGEQKGEMGLAVVVTLRD